MSQSTMFRLIALMAVVAIAYAAVCPTKEPQVTQKPVQNNRTHDCSKENNGIPNDISICRGAKRGDVCHVDRRRGSCSPVGNCDNDKCQLKCKLGGDVSKTKSTTPTTTTTNTTTPTTTQDSDEADDFD